jgi:hypothetical protein
LVNTTPSFTKISGFLVNNSHLINKELVSLKGGKVSISFNLIKGVLVAKKGDIEWAVQGLHRTASDPVLILSNL